MRFKTYFWRYHNINDKSLIHACFILMSVNINDVNCKLEAIQKLLLSENIIAQGVAFDYFCYTETLRRWGIENPYLKFSDLLLVKSRRQLQLEPITQVNLDNITIVGANHASALGVIKFIGQEEDISLIERILNSSLDTNVLSQACYAAAHCLEHTEKFYPKIIKALSKIIFEIEINLNVRESAVLAFKNYKLPEAEAILIKAAQQCQFEISAHAAWILGIWDLPKHLLLLQQISALWPHEVNLYAATEVVMLLENYGL